MMNEIKVLFNKDYREILKKGKEGRNTYWHLDSGEKITSKTLYSLKVIVKCHQCLKYQSPISFYGGKNGLLKRKYCCYKCLTTGEKNPFFGKNHSKEFKERMSNKRKGWWCVGENNFMFRKNIWDTYTEEERIEKKKKISKNQIGEKNHFFGKTHTEETRNKIRENTKEFIRKNPDHIKKMVEKSLKKQSSGLKSKIEKKTEDYLKNTDLKFKYSKILHRKYQYDFIIGENILLEVNGDYWHGNPKIYGEHPKRLLNDIQKFKIMKDIKKKEFAYKYGYKIYYIWESEINKNDFSSIDKIIKENKKEDIWNVDKI